MLLSAGTAEDLGTMTVSWGLTGFIWGTDTIMVMVRESRNTLRYLLEQPYFSLCSFPPEFHDKLYYCGRHSGRDVNKVQVCGFSPAEELGAPYFKEASTVYICRKLYSGTIDPASFSDRELFHTWYETGRTRRRQSPLFCRPGGACLEEQRVIQEAHCHEHDEKRVFR